MPIIKNNKNYGTKVDVQYPELTDAQITSNGTYQHTGYYGYDEVEVNVQPNLTTLNATSNNTYTPTSPVQGYSEVVVNVQPNLTTLNATSNDTYTPTSPVQGYSSVTVNVQPNLESLNATINGTYTPTSPAVGFDEVVVNVTAPAAPNYFYIENLDSLNGVVTIEKFSSNPSAPDVTVYCSTDQTNWYIMGTTSTTPITEYVAAKSKLYLKATATGWGNDWDIHNRISVDKAFNVGGNIMSLLYGDNYANQTTFPVGSTYTFYGLFRQNNNLYSAQNLVLPATTMVYQGYSNMFAECSNLCSAPELPATTLAQSCYVSMFNSCGNLHYAPALPATTLTDECYFGMFQYSGLYSTPVLPAGVLADTCYANMFNGCGGLTTVVTYADDISAFSCTTGWLNDVAAFGDFYNWGAAPFQQGSGDGIPQDWTEHSML